MTDREYYNKLAEFHDRNMKRAFIPKEEFSPKEYFEFQQEYRDFTMEYYRQKQQEMEAQKQLEKEIEEKAYDCVEDALEDFLKGFNGNINLKL